MLLQSAKRENENESKVNPRAENSHRTDSYVDEFFFGVPRGADRFQEDAYFRTDAFPTNKVAESIRPPSGPGTA